jgi:hypothetical protein
VPGRNDGSSSEEIHETEICSSAEIQGKYFILKILQTLNIAALSFALTSILIFENHYMVIILMKNGD